MSLKYNFAFKSSDLKKWEPKNKKNEIQIISNQQKLTNLIEKLRRSQELRQLLKSTALTIPKSLNFLILSIT